MVDYALQSPSAVPSPLNIWQQEGVEMNTLLLETSLAVAIGSPGRHPWAPRHSTPPARRAWKHQLSTHI